MAGSGCRAVATAVTAMDFISAVQKSDGTKAAQLLSDHPTIVDARDGKGDTALIIAINRGDQRLDRAFCSTRAPTPIWPAPRAAIRR